MGINKAVTLVPVPGSLQGAPPSHEASCPLSTLSSQQVSGQVETSCALVPPGQTGLNGPYCYAWPRASYPVLVSPWFWGFYRFLIPHSDLLACKLILPNGVYALPLSTSAQTPPLASLLRVCSLWTSRLVPTPHIPPTTSFSCPALCQLSPGPCPS